MSATRDESDDYGVDVRARPDAVWRGCVPARIPPGRWPADLDRSLAPHQQFAVNEIMTRPGAAPEPLAVNGLPGTGKTTLLRDLIAAIVVARAERLAELASPAEAFGPGARDHCPPGHARPEVTPLNPVLTGLEIVVASPGDSAAEHITRQIRGSAAIGSQWRAAADRLDYFTATARLVHGDGAWGLIAARLGDAASRRDFAERFWRGAPGRQSGRMADLLGDLPDQLARDGDVPFGSCSWDAARDEFDSARAKVGILAAERMEAALALIRLSGLRQDAATAYASIAAAEDTLRTLAGLRVAAEQSLRAASHRYGVMMKDLEAHARAKPGLRAQLSTRFGAGREWRARQAGLEAELRDRATPADAGRRELARVQERFAAAVRAQAGAAAALRRLTAECAAAREEIARARQRWGEHCPSGPEFFAASCAEGADAEARGELAAPWADPEFAVTRTELFLAALALHKALVAAQARRIGGNLNTLVDFLGGKGSPDDRALLAAWQTLFLVTPVVCTTFASLPALFGGLGPESVGWLLIQGAGQAPPRQEAGTVWRARRTVVMG